MYTELCELRRVVAGLEERLVQQETRLVKQQKAEAIHRETVFESTICSRSFDPETKCFQCYFLNPMKFIQIFDRSHPDFYSNFQFRQGAMTFSCHQSLPQHCEKSFTITLQLKTLVTVRISNSKDKPVCRMWNPGSDNWVPQEVPSVLMPGKYQFQKSTEGLAKDLHHLSPPMMNYEFKPFIEETIFLEPIFSEPASMFNNKEHADL